MGNYETYWVDYYEVLEIPFDATLEEIKKKFREMMRKYHPDVYQGVDGDEIAKLITEAYEVLSDDKEKAKYDEIYLSRKNGTYEENNMTDEEQATYTYEEMKETYSEEEIRFAQKLSFKKVIEEELEKAKIVIDAKNDLLFQAFNDNLFDEEYYQNVKEFMDLANEYIKSLYDLLEQAKSFKLFEETESLQEVIAFLEDSVNGIPTNIDDAKIFVEKEMVKEQLEACVTEEIMGANEAINQLLDFYKSIYLKKVSKIDFNHYHDVLLLNLKDSYSKLEKILELLKKDESTNLDEILKMQGRIEALLLSIPENYDDAFIFGKKENIKEKIEQSILSYDEYLCKVDKITRIIARHPFNKKVDFLYSYAHELLQELREDVEKMRGICNSEMSFNKVNDAEKISNEAIKLYEKVLKLSKNADSIYNKKETIAFDKKTIEILSQEALNLLDKHEALELLCEAKKLLEKNQSLFVFSDLYYKQLVDKICSYENILSRKYRKIDSIYKEIQKVTNDFYKYNNINPQDRLYVNELTNLINDYMNKCSNLENGSIGASISGFFSAFIWIYCLLVPDSSILLDIFVGAICIYSFYLMISKDKKFRICSENFLELKLERNARKRYYEMQDGKYDGLEGVFLRK